MKNITKIQRMGIEEWFDQAINDEHITPCLCFMCVGCENCDENCAFGIKEWLEREDKVVQFRK